MKEFWLIKFHDKMFVGKDGALTPVAIMAQRYDSEAEAQKAIGLLAGLDQSKCVAIQKQFKID